ncbi:MAG: glycosyltransferase family 2 protein [SAR202 cluster bacterium]|mgnify:FL=1|nr:glycosyltransferase family 2 protein [SAR202 cluster bacterium]|tara:strand:- start:1006 stop:1740 length:735 start_codon:yes stop_codon:yes gene_type:complete
MPLVDIVIPVLNEEKALPVCLDTLKKFLSVDCPYSCRIMIADNGSTDRTPEIASYLSKENQEVSWMRIEARGRGRALKQAWLSSTADIVAYMDVDLSTDLSSFPALVRSLDEENFDLAIGSRLMKGSLVRKRTVKREITSRCYNMIIKSMFLNKFSDAQCGFKAMTTKSARILLPKIHDNGWFFDSELLIVAEKCGFRIKDIPVTWVDDPDSRVNVIKTAKDDLRGLFRLRFGGLARAVREING